MVAHDGKADSHRETRKQKKQPKESALMHRYLGFTAPALQDTTQQASTLNPQAYPQELNPD
jgi:hypothetical protein